MHFTTKRLRSHFHTLSDPDVSKACLAYLDFDLLAPPGGESYPSGGLFLKLHERPSHSRVLRFCNRHQGFGRGVKVSLFVASILLPGALAVP